MPADERKVRRAICVMFAVGTIDGSDRQCVRTLASDVARSPHQRRW
jgi:hypothetical protein